MACKGITRTLALVALVLLAGCTTMDEFGSADPVDAATTVPPNASGDSTDSSPGTSITDVVPTERRTEDSAGDADYPDDERWFEEVAYERGIIYTVTGKYLGNGDGSVLVTDFDRDWHPDVLLIGGPHPELYRNTGGEFERSDALPRLEELEDTQIKGALFFDHDNDGWEDLVLFPLREAPIFLANDEGTFERADVGLDEPLAWATGASAADYDGDGCLDLFVTQNGNWSAGIPDRGARRSIADGDNGHPNVLYDGSCGEFERVEGAGIEGARWSLASSFVDLTGDGLPDVHVANDFNYDKIYVNQGDGTFEGRDIPETNRNGMASDVEDVNGDGRLDVFVTNVGYPNPDEIWVIQSSINVSNEGNNLLMNQGDGTFVDRGAEYGINVGLWGWSGNVVDIDNDGDLDVVHATKYHIRLPEGKADELVETRPSFWVRTGPESFEKQDSAAVGFEVQDARGLAAFDYDGDGDRDVLISNIVHDFRLYENVRADELGNSWLNVHAEGTAEQTAIGTEVYVTTADGTRFKVQNSKSNYFSQNPRTLGFGLGNATTVEELRVVYPDGTEHAFENVAVNGTVVVSYDGELRRVED